MRNCDTLGCVTEILDPLLAELDEVHLRREIDEHIDEAVAAFVTPPGPIQSQREFLNVLGDFVRHVSASGPRVSLALTSSQARAQAVALLEQSYQSTYHGGFEAALLDATDPGHGDVELVLARLAEVIKQVERQEHLRSVFIKSLATLSWVEKCVIARHLLDTCAPYLPANLSGCRAAQLADELPTLIDIRVSAQSCLGHVRGRTDQFR